MQRGTDVITLAVSRGGFTGVAAGAEGRPICEEKKEKRDESKGKVKYQSELQFQDFFKDIPLSAGVSGP